MNIISNITSATSEKLDNVIYTDILLMFLIFLSFI